MAIYSYYNLTPESQKKLQTWMLEVGVRSPIAPDDLHVTVLHSKEIPQDYKPSESTIKINPNTYSLDFDNFGKPPALVLKFRSYKLQTLYNKYKKEGAVSDFKYYNPHISLSYDGRSNKVLEGKINTPEFELILEKENSKIEEEEVPANSSANIAGVDLPINSKPIRRINVNKDEWEEISSMKNKQVQEKYSLINIKEAVIFECTELKARKFIKYGYFGI